MPVIRRSRHRRLPSRVHASSRLREGARAIIVNASAAWCATQPEILPHQRRRRRFPARGARRAGGARRDAAMPTDAQRPSPPTHASGAAGDREADWGPSTYQADLAVRVVDGVDEAVDHVGRWLLKHSGNHHRRARRAVRAFLARVGAAAVCERLDGVLAEDGVQLLSAEISISTDCASRCIRREARRGQMGRARASYRVEMRSRARVAVVNAVRHSRTARPSTRSRNASATMASGASCRSGSRGDGLVVGSRTAIAGGILGLPVGLDRLLRLTVRCGDGSSSACGMRRAPRSANAPPQAIGDGIDDGVSAALHPRRRLTHIRDGARALESTVRIRGSAGARLDDRHRSTSPHGGR